MKQLPTVGIIGLGSFGRFAASLVPRDMARVIGYDPAVSMPIEGVETVDLATVAQADVVILAIPLGAYPAMLEQLASLVPLETLIIDVCSVKVYPERHFKRFLPAHPNLLLTHPLFGPQSAGVSTAGHVLVVAASKGDRAGKVLAFCTDRLGLAVHHMSAEAHDKIMARIHVLTFFVARGLSAMDEADVPFMTPSYRMITDLITFDRTHSDELFQTIQAGNPFAEAMRTELVTSFETVAAGLHGQPEGEK